jgi:phenylpropionate dioxygenase-like ring-hydroxylating dioxygenase large terminal subunit
MFLGHCTDLENGQIKSLEILDGKKVLVNDNGNYKLGSNICPHQNSRIISGTTSALKCQYHGWSWDINGFPTGSGSSKMCNEARLHMKPVHEYKGLLFADPIDLSVLGDMSFDNLELDEFRIETLNADPKVSMDIFLDVDHIPVVHNGVYDLLGIEGEANVAWDFREWGSVQTVTDEQNNKIARWIAVYPYTMIEWQLGALFVSQCFNDNKIAVWKYKDINDTFENYKINSRMWEAAFAQDVAQAEQMVRLPTTIYLEDAKKHYREWLTNAISR